MSTERHRLSATERRALIEEAGARLFARHGFDATTVEDIVSAAGVSKPMLYRHFESKRDLHMRLMERRRDELASEPLTKFLEATGPQKKRLAEMVDAWFAHVEHHPDTAKMLFQDAPGDQQIQSLQAELRRRQRAADVAMLREWGPPLPEAEMEPLGEIIRSALTGLALWWLDNPEVPRSAVVGAMLRTTQGILGGD
ncbi:MAG TPA: TetR/AcrR family transcriptional regulator [Solirubrobacteraceae bacterium]|nr:TetR/AcrR family transcriptional regulator [Solirubrobacteraceae bacterium]